MKFKYVLMGLGVVGLIVLVGCVVFGYGGGYNGGYV